MAPRIGVMREESAMISRRFQLGIAVLCGMATLAPSAASAQYRPASSAYDGRGDRGAPPPPYDERDRAYADGRRNGRCRDNGAGGTILGAIAGGLLGGAAAGRGDRGAGTVIGAGVGALAGRAAGRHC